MSDDRFDRARLDELAHHAELREYEFASAAPGVGGFVARFRAAWNSVATKWQVRPLIEQQSAFNAALVEWLARRQICLLYTSPSPRDGILSRMPSSA